MITKETFKTQSVDFGRLDAKSQKNLVSLKRHYQRHPIVLYTGAGVSMQDQKTDTQKRQESKMYGLPGWPRLLEQIYVRGAKGNTKEFQSQICKGNLWKTADWVVGQFAGAGKAKKVAAFQRTLVGIVQQHHNFAMNRHRQLNLRFLANAATLNSVTAFCGLLSGVVTPTAEQEERHEIRYAVRSNPRIRAVLTSNYDPFQEAASSSKYRRPLLKPVAAFGSLAGSLDQVPVFHIHGYVPHPQPPTSDKAKRRKRKPYLEKLVLTQVDYDLAWNTEDSYSPTMAPQVHYLRHYVTLFVGFSFNDDYVCRLLEELNQQQARSDADDDAARLHYALVQQSLADRLDDSFKRMGVAPIYYPQHSDVPELLGMVYKSGVMNDGGSGRTRLPYVQPRSYELASGSASLTKDDYWSALLACRDAKHHAKNLAMPLQKIA